MENKHTTVVKQRRREENTHLSPLPVAAAHVDRSDVLEELLGRDEFGQPGQQLSHVDEVHGSENVLKETQQAQRRAKQELLAVPAEHVPHPTRQVQRQRLAVQSEDPAETKRREQERPALYFQDRLRAGTTMDAVNKKHNSK